jgi:hypothetical protein
VSEYHLGFGDGWRAAREDEGADEAAYTRGFNYGFWSAIMLVAGVVIGGLLVMRVM